MPIGPGDMLRKNWREYFQFSAPEIAGYNLILQTSEEGYIS